MLNRNFLVLAFLVVFGSFLVAFSNAKSESKAVYEYVTIKQSDSQLEIAEQGKPATLEYLKRAKSGLNTSYELINNYEASGYELFTSNVFMTNNSTQVSYFLLRRKKQ